MAKCATRARHDRFPLTRPLSAAEVSEALACDRPTADISAEAKRTLRRPRSLKQYEALKPECSDPATSKTPA